MTSTMSGDQQVPRRFASRQGSARPERLLLRPSRDRCASGVVRLCLVRDRTCTGWCRGADRSPTRGARARLPFLLRIPAGVTSLIKPALDAGVHGLIIPQVRTVAEVRAVVDDCRYAPEGRRGLGPVFASSYRSPSLSVVVDRSVDDLFIAIQIENADALAVVEEIASIEGIDALVVGPTDLSDSLGLRGQFDNPAVIAAIDRIVLAARSNGLSVGAGVGDAAHAVAMIRRGAQWIQLSGADAYVAALRAIDERCPHRTRERRAGVNE